MESIINVYISRELVSKPELLPLKNFETVDAICVYLRTQQQMRRTEV